MNLPRAILFDMDGTLTRPMLDFAQIKAEMGIGSRPILEAMAEMNAIDRERARAILDRHEDLAADQSVLNDGCESLIAWLAERGVETALVTRNSRRSTETILRRHDLKFAVLVTRENPPFKPDPAPLLLACDRLGVSPAHAWMVGDGQYDIEAALAAKITAVWLSHGKQRHFSAAPWKTVADLGTLADVLMKIA